MLAGKKQFSRFYLAHFFFDDDFAYCVLHVAVTKILDD